MKAERAGLMNIMTQWMYVVTDSDASSSFESNEILQAKDGYNIAFMYNASVSSANADCRVHNKFFSYNLDRVFNYYFNTEWYDVHSRRVGQSLCCQQSGKSKL